MDAKGDSNRWNYATWQMKVNLIYDMRNGLTDWIDDYSNEERGEAVLTVLRTARHAVEFNKIVNGLKKPDYGLDSAYIEDLITKQQLPEWELLQMKYQLI